MDERESRAGSSAVAAGRVAAAVGRAETAPTDATPTGTAAGATAFRGYNPIRYTPCPDEFFDEQLAVMDDDELRVTLYAFRRTFGFKKTDDAISISQFLHGITTRDGRRLDAGCGLKTPRQVLAGLAKAEARRTLLSAFYCRACTSPVPTDAMAEEERCQRLVNGEQRRYTVRVVPRLCPTCGARLRGFEEKRYHLNVLDEPTRPARETATPSIAVTDPPAALPPSVATTDPLYPRRSRASARGTDTRDRLQHTAKQDALAPAVDDVLETIDPPSGPGDPSVFEAATGSVAPVFLPPGSRLPSPQLWAAAVAQAATALDRVDRDGWVRAAALLAAELAATPDGPLTLVLGVPTEHARRRCATRAGGILADALSLLLGRSVILRPVVTGRWLAGQER